jgi:hypothetical protein
MIILFGDNNLQGLYIVGNSNSINGRGRLQLKAGRAPLDLRQVKIGQFLPCLSSTEYPSMNIEGANPNPNDPTNGFKAQKTNRTMALLQ